MDINNNYKRFQGYQNNNVSPNNLKKDFIEQNYKINNKSLGERQEFGKKQELPQQDNSFLKNATRLSVNSQGKFFKK